MSRWILIADDREREVVQALEQSRSTWPPNIDIVFRVERLDVGDFQLFQEVSETLEKSEEHGEKEEKQEKEETGEHPDPRLRLVAVWERKTWADYRSSIADGRKHEQVHRLEAFARANAGARLFLLLEGTHSLGVGDRSQRRGHVRDTAVARSIMRLTEKDPWALWRTTSPTDSAHWIGQYLHVCVGASSAAAAAVPGVLTAYDRTVLHQPPPAWTRGFSKKNAQSDEDSCALRMLSQCPGVSEKVICELLRTYACEATDLFRQLLKDVRDDGEGLSKRLQELKPSGRRWGKASQGLYKMLVSLGKDER